MIIDIQKEEDRIKAAVKYVEEQIEDLDFQINNTYYYEAPNGDLVYDKHAYVLERVGLVTQKYKYQTLLRILTESVPRIIVC